MMLQVSVAVLLLLSPAIATPCRSNVDAQQVNGGISISPDDYVWFVALSERGSEDDLKVICSGALISRRHVITADRCLDGRHVNSLRARVSYFCPQYDNCGCRLFEDHDVIEHRRDPSVGDVAILVLSNSSAFPPAIPDVRAPPRLDRIKKGGSMIMVAAGRDGPSGQISAQVDTLRLRLEHTKFRKCRNAIGDEELREQLVSKATICSSSDQGSTCKGDFGAPILAEEGGDVIVAIHNYGREDCSSAEDDSLLGHLALSGAAQFVIAVVCVGKRKPKWCPRTPSTTFPETCPPLASTCPPAPECPLPPLPTPIQGGSLEATLLHNLTDHAESVLSVAFDATSSRLASADNGQRVNVWDPTNGGSPLLTFDLDDGCCLDALAFHPAGTILAGDDSADVALLNVGTGTDANRKLEGLTDAQVDGLAWHPDGNLLASGGRDNTIKLWELASGTVLHTFQGHADPVRSVSFDPRGSSLASASNDGTIRIWNVSTSKEIRTLEEHDDGVTSVAYSPDGTRLASGSFDQNIRVWRASDGAPVATFHVGSIVRSVAWSPDSEFLVSGSNDGMVRVWKATGGNGDEAMLNLTEPSEAAVASVTWSPNGNWIASASHDTTVKIWEIRRQCWC